MKNATTTLMLAALLVSACSSSSSSRSSGGSPDSGSPPDATASKDALSTEASFDATPDVDKAATCAASFGDALTNAFGRLDGTVLAIVPPGDETCADPNATHLVIQVTIGGVPYRMVVDVLSNSGNPDVFFYEEDAPLAAGAWQEGWHAGVALDYVGTLNLHSTVFTEMQEAALVAKVTSEIQLGDAISVFATSMDEPDSAHLIHRNLTNQDGAIVLRPQSANPHYLLFRFDEQSF